MNEEKLRVIAYKLRKQKAEIRGALKQSGAKGDITRRIIDLTNEIMALTGGERIDYRESLSIEDLKELSLRASIAFRDYLRSQLESSMQNM
ncbi:MAG: hypothetical protein ACP5KE_05055 [Candidatus Methanodesulfokora sp.]|jgi:hypothetical protein|nr:MAG: hypothetical protein C0200_07520 [Candidatus Korarchaeota archaeon]